MFHLTDAPASPHDTTHAHTQPQNGNYNYILSRLMQLNPQINGSGTPLKFGDVVCIAI